MPPPQTVQELTDALIMVWGGDPIGNGPPIYRENVQTLWGLRTGTIGAIHTTELHYELPNKIHTS